MMISSRPRSILLAAGCLAAATALVSPTSPAHAATLPTATIGDVVCVEGDGTVQVDLQAGDSDAATFLVLLDGGSSGDDTVLDAGATGTVQLVALEDDEHTVEVLAAVGDSDFDTVASADATVACDPAPDGPYTNVKGAVFDDCQQSGSVSASNKVIGGNAADLQDVDFEVVFTPTDDVVDDPGDGTDPGAGGNPDDPVDPAPRTTEIGVQQLLDSFTLGAANQTYERTFGPEELGGTGDLTLRTGETVVATEHISLCEVVVSPPIADSGASGEVPQALPSTGY